MSTKRDFDGAMNPFATPFIPLASPQSSFATPRTKKPRSSLRAGRYEGEDLLSPRDQVMLSSMREGELMPPLSLLVSPHLPRKARCEVSQGHAATNRACDQIHSPTTPTSGQNTSFRLKIDPQEGFAHGPENKRNRAKRSSAAGGMTIESLDPNIGGERGPELPKAKVPQTHRMSGEDIASDANNGAVLYNVRSHKPCKLGISNLSSRRVRSLCSQRVCQHQGRYPRARTRVIYARLSLRCQMVVFLFIRVLQYFLYCHRRRRRQGLAFHCFTWFPVRSCLTRQVNRYQINMLSL